MVTVQQRKILESFAREQPAAPIKREFPRFQPQDDAFWRECFLLFFNDLMRLPVSALPESNKLALNEDLPWETDSDWSKIIRIAARMADTCVIEKLERLP